MLTHPWNKESNNDTTQRKITIPLHVRCSTCESSSQLSAGGCSVYYFYLKKMLTDSAANSLIVLPIGALNKGMPPVQTRKGRKEKQKESTTLICAWRKKNDQAFS